MKKFFKLIRNEEGATAIEYGLIAALIAVAAITAMQGPGQPAQQHLRQGDHRDGQGATKPDANS